MLWVFGDTYTHADQDTGTRETGLVFGNTIAVHPLGSPASTPPQANDIPVDTTTSVRFYARSHGTQSPWDITFAAVPLIGAYPGALGFFGASCTGLSGLHWPGDGVFQGGTLGLFTFKVAGYENWAVIGHRVQKFSVGSGSEGNPASWTCQAPGVIPNQYTSESPTLCDQMLDPSLLWGLSVAKIPSGQTDAGHTYIFGARANPCWIYGGPCGACPLLNLHIAKVETDTAIHTYPTGWKFYYKAGTTQCPGSSPCWSTGTPNTAGKRNNLQVAATDVGPELSVHYATPVGKPAAWVMVHGGLVPLIDLNGTDYTPGLNGDPLAPTWLQNSVALNDRQIVMRTSNNPRSFPLPQNGGSPPRLVGA